jgi:hypothetical protein
MESFVQDLQVRSLITIPTTRISVVHETFDQANERLQRMKQRTLVYVSLAALLVLLLVLGQRTSGILGILWPMSLSPIETES